MNITEKLKPVVFRGRCAGDKVGQSGYHCAGDFSFLPWAVGSQMFPLLYTLNHRRSNICCLPPVLGCSFIIPASDACSHHPFYISVLKHLFVVHLTSFPFSSK